MTITIRSALLSGNKIPRHKCNMSGDYHLELSFFLNSLPKKLQIIMSAYLACALIIMQKDKHLLSSAESFKACKNLLKQKQRMLEVQVFWFYLLSVRRRTFFSKKVN